MPHAYDLDYDLYGPDYDPTCPTTCVALAETGKVAKTVKVISAVFFVLFLYLFGAISYNRLDYFGHVERNQVCQSTAKDPYNDCFGKSFRTDFERIVWPISYTAVFASATADLFFPPKVVN